MRWIFYFLLLVNIIYFSRSFTDQDKKQIEKQPINAVLAVESEDRSALMLPISQGEGMILPSELQSDHPPADAKMSMNAVASLEGSLLDVNGLSNPEWFSASKERHCILIGPYENQETAVIDSFFSSHNIDHKSEAIETEIVTGYWVYIDEGFDQSAANRFMKDLRKQGIDSYVIADSALENRVSLGLFKNVENALNRQKQLIKDGFQNVHTSPRIKKIQKNKAQAVLHGDLAFDSLKSYLREKDLDIKISENTCI